MIPGGSMIQRHRWGVDWKVDNESFAKSPYGPALGAVYDVVVFDREDPLAPVKDADPTDPADIFVHLLRPPGFRYDQDLFIALQQFSRIEGETWAVILRDAMAEQLADEAAREPPANKESDGRV